MSPEVLPTVLPILQDTTVVALARDGLATFTAWALGSLLIAFAVLLAVLLLVLAEMRRLSASWTDFLATATTRSETLVASATSAARNIDRISGTIKEEMVRLGGSFGNLAGGIENASAQLQHRLKDLLALVDLAQAEAEDAVLEAASSIRALRANAGGFLLSQLRRGGRAESSGQDAAPERDEVSGIDAPDAGEAAYVTTPSPEDEGTQK